MRTKIIKEDLEILLNHLWHDELRHYSESPRRNHIFLALRRLAQEIDYKTIDV